MLSAALLFVLAAAPGCSGATKGQRSDPHTPPSANIGAHPADARPAPDESSAPQDGTNVRTRCGLPERAHIVVLDFDYSYDSRESYPATKSIAEALAPQFRTEASNSGLTVSAYSMRPMETGLSVDCRAEAIGTVSCLSAAGKSLRAEWLLSGQVTHKLGHYVVEIQLVSTSANPAVSVVAYDLVDRQGLISATHTAWFSVTSVGHLDTK